MGNETYTPNKGTWVDLPSPTSKHWDFADRVGSLIYRLNPRYLAYWNPDVAGRGFLFAGVGVFGGLAWLFGMAYGLPEIWAAERPENVPVWIYLTGLGGLTLLGPLALLTCVLCLKRPLPPPTFFNRAQQQVMQYQKLPGKKGRWLIWNWADITPAVRQANIYSSAGRSTMYVLVLMKLEPGSNKILESFGAYTSSAVKLPCVQAWEYMRRYMNEPPERVPPAYIPPFGFDRKTWAVRCQIESMQVGMNPDGTFQNWFARLFVPIYGTAVYAPMWATLWIEKTAPKVPLPPEIEALNRWDDQLPNPYKIEHAYGGPGSEHPVTEIYERIKVRHWVMTAISFGVYGGLLLTMLSTVWLKAA